MNVDRPTDAGARDDAGDDALRTELIEGIRRHRQEFENAGQRSERIRALPADAARTLRKMGMFWLKTPGELGGTPLTPLEFCDVMEELGYTFYEIAGRLRGQARFPRPKAVSGR